MKTKHLLALTLAAVAMTACTDAEFDKNLRWNNPASVICYSNGTKTLDDVSTGSVKFSENGAGFYYRSKVTHKFIQVVRSECTIKEL